MLNISNKNEKYMIPILGSDFNCSPVLVIKSRNLTFTFLSILIDSLIKNSLARAHGSLTMQIC